MLHINKKLRVSALATLLALGLPSVSYAMVSSGGTVSSSAAAGEYSGKLTGVKAGREVTGKIGDVSKKSWAGVIELSLYNQSGALMSKAGTFCTDLQHPTYLSELYKVSPDRMSCELRYLATNYPAVFSGINNVEAAARQSAVWHFADGFVVESPLSVVNRVAAIASDVRANAAAACASFDQPLVMSYKPSSINLYEGGEVEVTISAKRAGQPVAGKVIPLTTNFGALSASSVVTNEFGEATVTFSASGPGQAVIRASANYVMPAGTIFDGLTVARQRLVLADSQEGVASIEIPAMVLAAQGSVIVKVFHDRNLNAVDEGSAKNEEALAGWDVTLYNSDGSVFGNAQTDSTGVVVFNNVPSGDYTATYSFLNDTWFDTNTTVPLTTAQVEAITVNEDSHSVDFGVIRTPFVDVCVFMDNNKDNEVNEGEQLLSGWDVELFRANGSAVLGSNATTGDGDRDGQATLTFLRHSDFTLGGTEYFVALAKQDGWEILNDAQLSGETLATTDQFVLTTGDFEDTCFGILPWVPGCEDAVVHVDLTTIGYTVEGGEGYDPGKGLSCEKLPMSGTAVELANGGSIDFSLAASGDCSDPETTYSATYTLVGASDPDSWTATLQRVTRAADNVPVVVEDLEVGAVFNGSVTFDNLSFLSGVAGGPTDFAAGDTYYDYRVTFMSEGTSCGVDLYVDGVETGSVDLYDGGVVEAD